MSAAEKLDPRAMRDIRLIVIPKEQVEKEWPTVYPLLSQADIYTSGRYAAHTLLGSLLAGESALMVAADVSSEPYRTYAAFVIEVHGYDLGKKVFAIILAGGSHIDRWKHLYPAFKQKAKDMGCNQLEITGRRGWKRFLAPSCHETSTTFIDEAF